MESVWEKLAKVDILDIYDEIAELPITDDQVRKMCLSTPCRVALTKVNLVYAVEEKYKVKLELYSQGKVLKWLRVYLPQLLPDPEAKYFKWQERRQRRDKIEWMLRKAEAIQPLPPPTNGSSGSESEYGECSRSGFLNYPKTVETNIPRMSITTPCKVDLRQLNLVYLVEQKYKKKLSTYKKSKALEWLRVNLPKLLPNPEAKYLKLQKSYQRKANIPWVKRKALLQAPISSSSECEEESAERHSNSGFLNYPNTVETNFPRISITTPCKVDLRQLNLVYLVEQKYKKKLSTYKKSKALEWLRVNLPRLLPNPEAKYLKLQKSYQRKDNIPWVKRKAEAITLLLPAPISSSSECEEVSAERHSEPKSAQLMAEFSELMEASISSIVSEELPPPYSQSEGSSNSKSAQMMTEFSELMEASISSIVSEELPPPFSQSEGSSNSKSAQMMTEFSELMEASISSIVSEELPLPFSQSEGSSNSKSAQMMTEFSELMEASISSIVSEELQPPFSESEGFSSGDEHYSVHVVTSSQEFG